MAASKYQGAGGEGRWLGFRVLMAANKYQEGGRGEGRGLGSRVPMAASKYQEGGGGEMFTDAMMLTAHKTPLGPPSHLLESLKSRRSLGFYTRSGCFCL